MTIKFKVNEDEDEIIGATIRDDDNYDAWISCGKSDFVNLDRMR